jgi:hypothetical protein
MTVAETWVELDDDDDDALCIVEEEEVHCGVYMASSVCQVNSNKTIVILLNPTEESIEITNLKR